VLTGPDCARIYGDVLDRDVSYGGNDLDAWEAQSRSMLPAWMAYDFRIMYAGFQENGLIATTAHQKETRRILGEEPRSFQSFAQQVVKQWKKRPAKA
jgi:hypothetical protein